MGVHEIAERLHSDLVGAVDDTGAGWDVDVVLVGPPIHWQGALSNAVPDTVHGRRPLGVSAVPHRLVKLEHLEVAYPVRIAPDVVPNRVG